MSRSPDIAALSAAEPRVLVVELLSRVGDLSAVVIELRAEIARLKGLKGRPDIKPPSTPSGMDKASRSPGDGGPKRRGGGLKTAKRVIHEDRVIPPSQPVPPGSRYKGTADVVVRDLVLRAHVIRYRRERWLTPSGETIIAPFPRTIHGHFGPEPRRYVLMRYHQGQVTVPRLLDQLRAFGIDISKRQLVRLLIAHQDDFRDEAQGVLRMGLATAGWISVDDTGARHKGRNGVRTQIGNHLFTAFKTTGSKSRLNVLDCLRAGHTDYVVNDAALAYMAEHALAGPLATRFAAHPVRAFADAAAWDAHLASLGIRDLAVTPNPARVATEGEASQRLQHAERVGVARGGALWGSIAAHGFLHDAVILSDDAGQFKIGPHALCWIHAERLVHKLDAYTEADRLAKERDIPLHNNGSERDIRCHVTKRKISGGPRSDIGRDCRDAFLGLMKTCRKLGMTFWDYIGARLGVPYHKAVAMLADIIKDKTEIA